MVEAIKSTKRVRNNNGYRVFVINPDGRIDTFEQKKAPDYLQLQQLVEGTFETVPHFKRYVSFDRGVAYCNDNWVGKQLPYNEEATRAWKACTSYSEKTKHKFSYEPVLGGIVVFYAKIPAKLSTGPDAQVLT